jgi:hypothetical protein
VNLKRLLAEPLVHFLIAGAALFVLFNLVGESDATRKIVVDSDRLLDFLQLGSNPLEASPSGLRLEDLSKDQLERLIGNYIREEALYREARALGLDENDAVFRRQLIRRLESVNRMVVSSGIRVSEADLEAFLAEHEDRYRLPPTVTFTHVYFGIDNHGTADAGRLAAETLKRLNRDRTPFHEAPSKGDRFLYHPNYVNKSAEEIASHFGDEFQQKIFSREPDGTEWFGPLRSTYGFHLVLLTARSAGGMPPLGDIRRRVEADAYQARLQAEVDLITGDIVDSYDIHLDEALQSLTASSR